MSVETYAHVHHIVSNVSGRLRNDVSPIDVIRALFPGGTITGCPKVRCMEIIAELEAVGRGAYTGSIGYLNRDGSCDLNILIRTITAQGGLFKFRAGAGIVADSNPTQELAETRAKAEGLLRALVVRPLSAWINGRQQHADRLSRPRPAIRRRLVRNHAGAPRPGPVAGISSRTACSPVAGGCKSAAPAARARCAANSRAPRDAAQRGRTETDRHARRVFAPRLSAHGPRAMHAHPHAASACREASRRGSGAGSAAPVRNAAGTQSASRGPQNPQSPGVGGGARRMA